MDIFEDPELRRARRLIAIMRDEADKLEAALPAALDAQWSIPPVDRPRVDTSDRIRPSRVDPTYDIATDERRIRLREQVVRSLHVMRQAAVVLRGTRVGLEITLAAWQGEGE